MFRPPRYLVETALPLIEAGKTYGEICQTLGWNAKNAVAIQRYMQNNGYAENAWSGSRQPVNRFWSKHPRPRTNANDDIKISDIKLPDTPAPSRPGDPPAAEDAFSGNKWTAVRAASQVPMNEAELVELFQVDLTVWEIVAWKAKAWQMGFKAPDGEGTSLPLFSVAAEFKKKTLVIAVRTEIDALIEQMRLHSPVYSPSRYYYREEEGFLFEPSIYDVHFGKLSWPEESGDAYDIGIAKERYDEAIDYLIQQSGHYNIQRVLFPVGHDFFHVDTRENKTTHGTAVTADSRQQKVFRVGVAAAIRAIDKLRLIAPVDVVMVPGNHDSETNFTLGEVLSAWYRLDDAVNVDNRARSRKYYEFKRVMLQLTHGSEETSQSRLSEVAAAEEPEMWGRTTFRESHCGHLHKNFKSKGVEVDERTGYVTRIITALSASDDWHFGKAFVKNKQGAESFIWSGERGLISHNFYTVPSEW